jgi:hypothetical protein
MAINKKRKKRTMRKRERGGKDDIVTTGYLSFM